MRLRVHGKGCRAGVGSGAGGMGSTCAGHAGRAHRTTLPAAYCQVPGRHTRTQRSRKHTPLGSASARLGLGSAPATPHHVAPPPPPPPHPPPPTHTQRTRALRVALRPAAQVLLLLALAVLGEPGPEQGVGLLVGGPLGVVVGAQVANLLVRRLGQLPAARGARGWREARAGRREVRAGRRQVETGKREARGEGGRVPRGYARTTLIRAHEQCM